MRETIEAIYEKGVLRPLKTLSILEGQKIRIIVERDSDDTELQKIKNKSISDFSKLAGCLSLNPRFSSDPVAVQRELRDEWS